MYKRQAKNGRVLWVDAIGGETSRDSVTDIAIGLNQEVLVTGAFEGELRHGRGGLISQPGGESDIYIVSYSSSGEPKMSLRLGAEKQEFPRSMFVDASGRIYLFAKTGYLEFGEIFVLPAGNYGGSMFCFDEAGEALWGIGGLSSIGEVVAYPDPRGSRFLVQGFMQPGEVVLQGYSDDLLIQQEGLGYYLLLSMEGAPWDVADGNRSSHHPADLNEDWRLDINEVTGYGRAWKTGELWENAPNPIPINYVTRAGAIWKNGESYAWVTEEGEAPRGWVNQSE